MTQQEKQYAALAPIMALAGVFVDPIATTILPLILYFIFNWKHMEFARLVALRAADLAFSMQLIIFLASLLLMLYLNFYTMTDNQARGIMSFVTLLVIIYMGVSLIIGIVQAFRGRHFSYFLSFKIGERVLAALARKNMPQ